MSTTVQSLIKNLETNGIAVNGISETSDHWA